MNVIDLGRAFAAKRSTDARSKREGIGPNLARALARLAFRAKKARKPEPPSAA